MVPIVTILIPSLIVSIFIDLLENQEALRDISVPVKT